MLSMQAVADGYEGKNVVIVTHGEVSTLPCQPVQPLHALHENVQAPSTIIPDSCRSMPLCEGHLAFQGLEGPSCWTFMDRLQHYASRHWTGS